jgi:hypothetical protein
MKEVRPDVGTVACLSVGKGDIKLSFDPESPAERIRAARVVADMLRRGYAILVEVDGKWTRAESFREDKCEYVIADFDSAAAVRADREEARKDEESEAGAAGEAPAAPAEEFSPVPPEKRRRGPKPRLRTVKAESVRTVAVGRTAGG